MASIEDLASYITARRLPDQQALQVELLRLRAMYGGRPNGWPKRLPHLSAHDIRRDRSQGGRGAEPVGETS